MRKKPGVGKDTTIYSLMDCGFQAMWSNGNVDGRRQQTDRRSGNEKDRRLYILDFDDSCCVSLHLTFQPFDFGAMQMKKIFKYILHSVSTPLSVPVGAETLCCKKQNDKPCIWMLVDPDAPMENRLFTIYGTGHEMPDNPGKYIGTFYEYSGTLVFHVFEEKA